MAYFSQLALAQDFLGNRPDLSFTTPIMVLKWRIEDLERRLEELNERGSPNKFCKISREVLPYVLPEHMHNAGDVSAAIELAQQRLSEELDAEKKEYYEEAIPCAYLPYEVIKPVVPSVNQKERVMTREFSI